MRPFLPRENHCSTSKDSDAKCLNDENNGFSNANQNTTRKDQSTENVNHQDKSLSTINQTAMTTDGASQMTVTDHSTCDTLKHNTKSNQNRENVDGQKDDTCEDLFNVFLRAWKLEENHKIRQETRSPILSASADGSDRFLSLPSVSACTSLVNPAGQSSLTAHVVSGQIVISDASHFVSPARGGSKMFEKILKAIPKMHRHHPKGAPRVDTERPEYCHELVLTPNTRRRVTSLPFSFVRSYYPWLHIRHPATSLLYGFKSSLLPLASFVHPRYALMGVKNGDHSKKVPGPPEGKGSPQEGGEKVSQGPNEGSQGTGEQEGEGDSGGGSAPSGSGGASGGGGGDNRKDDQSSANSNDEEVDDEEEEEDEEQQEAEDEACDSGPSVCMTILSLQMR